MKDIKSKNVQRAFKIGDLFTMGNVAPIYRVKRMTKFGYFVNLSKNEKDRELAIKVGKEESLLFLTFNSNGRLKCYCAPDRKLLLP